MITRLVKIIGRRIDRMRRFATRRVRRAFVSRAPRVSGSHLEWRGSTWLWSLIFVGLLVVGMLLFGDQPPMAAIISVLL